MLEKSIQIKSIGRFRHYAASGDVTFRKLTPSLRKTAAAGLLSV
jgi:hypothetical protein